MVAIAQLVEHLIVVQKVARSSRVGHPTKTLPFAEGFCFFSLNSPLLGYRPNRGLRVKMCVWLGVSRGLDLAFLNAD